MAEDADLLHAYARRGDVRSLSALVKRHAAWMQALLRGLLPSAADADDALTKALKDYNLSNAVELYLNNMADRKALNNFLV